MPKSVYVEYTLSWSHEWILGKAENMEKEREGGKKGGKERRTEGRKEGKEN